MRFSVTSFHHYFRNWRFCRSCCCCCFFFKLCIVANSVQRIRETIFQTSKGKEIAREKIEAKRVRVIHHLKPPQKTKGWYTVDWLWKAGFFTWVYLYCRKSLFEKWRAVQISLNMVTITLTLIKMNKLQLQHTSPVVWKLSKRDFYRQLGRRLIGKQDRSICSCSWISYIVFYSALPDCGLVLTFLSFEVYHEGIRKLSL